MSPILILLVGMVVVVGAVLVLRLHAFLALVLGALCVAGLTPRSALFQSSLAGSAIEIAHADAETGTLHLRPSKKQKALGGLAAILHREAAGDLTDLQAVEVTIIGLVKGDPNLVEARIEPGLTIESGDRLVSQAALAAAKKAADTSIGETISSGFGDTCSKIGILIAMAAIIGKCLLDSGAAEAIVAAMRRLLGDRRAGLTFLGSGFIVGIPVFFDTVFYLLMPLGKAMAIKSGKNYVFYVLCIVAGATMAHSLVPPTPGPLFAAGELGVDVGLMMLGGLVVGIITSGAGYFYARWADLKWNIPLRASLDLDEKQLAEMAGRDESTLPPVFVSLLPILLPVVLIAGGTVVSMMGTTLPGQDFWSNKDIALVLAAAVALILLIQRKGVAAMGPAVQSALASGGVIILITAAGGAFGGTLKQTGISNEIASMGVPASATLIWILVAWGATALVRIAQGSATVAMITAVGIVAPIANMGGLGFHPLYLALAIGCGSKPVLWMNDSGFWIISKMAGFSEGETFKTASMLMALMGVVGLIVTLLGAWLFPLV